MKEQFWTYITSLQNVLKNAFQEMDARVEVEGGEQTVDGRKTLKLVLQNGSVFEKASICVNSIAGELPFAKRNFLNVKDDQFSTCGIDIVVHPVNPFVPTVHLQLSYFELYNQKDEIVNQWFEGGMNLVPNYYFEEDAIHFHQVCKDTCDDFDFSFYSQFKHKCDEFYYHHHRKEAIGIGGILFKQLKANEELNLHDLYEFVTSVGNRFFLAYFPILEKRMHTPYTDENRRWQEIRRGNYAEFDLLYNTDGDFAGANGNPIERVLMSLPPEARWQHNYQPEKGSVEEELLTILKTQHEWIEKNYWKSEIVNMPPLIQF